MCASPRSLPPIIKLRIFIIVLTIEDCLPFFDDFKYVFDNVDVFDDVLQLYFDVVYHCFTMCLKMVHSFAMCILVLMMVYHFSLFNHDFDGCVTICV
jgi:hypothetical protein